MKTLCDTTTSNFPTIAAQGAKIVATSDDWFFLVVFLEYLVVEAVVDVVDTSVVAVLIERTVVVVGVVSTRNIVVVDVDVVAVDVVVIFHGMGVEVVSVVEVDGSVTQDVVLFVLPVAIVDRFMGPFPRRLNALVDLVVVEDVWERFQ